VKKKGKLFERVFDRRLRVISEAAGQAEAE
jgi:hypothetical protein